MISNKKIFQMVYYVWSLGLYMLLVYKNCGFSHGTCTMILLDIVIFLLVASCNHDRFTVSSQNIVISLTKGVLQVSDI